MAKSKGLPQLYQEDNGYYYVRGTGDDGKSFERSLKTKDETKAHRDYADFLHDHLNMKSAADVADALGHRTVHWCLDFYQEKHVPKIASVLSRRNAIYYLDLWRAYWPKDFMVNQITTTAIDTWKEKRRKEPRVVKVRGGKTKVLSGGRRRGEDRADATLRNELIALRTCFNYAVKKKRLLSTDVPEMDLPDSTPVRTDNWVDEDGAMKLLRQFATARPGGRSHKKREGCLPGLFILGVLMFGTGARITAAAELEWDRVHWPKNGQPGYIDFLVPGQPVPKRKRRIPDATITDWMLPILRRAHAERHRDGNEGRYVCVKLQSWTSIFGRHAILAGFVRPDGTPLFTSHGLKHSHISLTLQSGASIWEVSQNVRVSPEVLEEVYGHSSKQSRAKVAAKAIDQKKMRRLSLGVIGA